MDLTDTGAVTKPRPSGWQAAGLLAAGVGEIGAGALGEVGGGAADSTGIGAAGGIALGAVSFMAIKDGIDKFGSGFEGAFGSSHHPPAATTVDSSNHTPAPPTPHPGTPSVTGQSGQAGGAATGPHSQTRPEGTAGSDEGGAEDQTPSPQLDQLRRQIGDPRAFDPQSIRGLSGSDVESVVPRDWERSDSKAGDGVVYRDPKNPGRQIRIMPGYNAGNRPDVMTHGPYAVVSQNGGKPVKIPLEGNPTLGGK